MSPSTSLRATKSRGNPFLILITLLIMCFTPCQAAIEFDGIDDYFSVANHSSLKPVDKITIGYWFKRSPGQKNQLGAFQSATVANSDYILQVFSDNLIYVSVPNGGSNQYFVSTSMTLDTGWNSLYAVYDGTQAGNSNRLKVYLNGALVAGTYVGTIPAVLNQGSLPIENRYNLHYNQGLMGDARIYNRALSETEIETLYKSRSKRPSGSLANGLVAHYEMDDDAIGEVAAQAKDGSGNLNHGQFVGFDNLVSNGFSTDVPAVIGAGNSLEFDGVDDYIDLGAMIVPQKTVTVSTWIKKNEVNTNDYNLIAGRWNYTQGGYGLFTGNLNDEIVWSLSGGGMHRRFDTNSANLQANTWYHVAATFNANTGGSAKIFINGINQSLTIVETDTITSLTTPTNIGTIGYDIADISGYFNGYIDEVHIYNKELSDEEISFLYNGSGIDPDTSNLQALWTFDDDSALKDSSGNNNHGVGVGGDSLKYTDGVLRR